MSKLRKSVVKQKSRGQAQKQTGQRVTPVATEAALRDRFLYSSSMKAFLIAIVLFILSVWCAGAFEPFDDFKTWNGNVYEVTTGAINFCLFLFIIIAWGNALEINGNVIEWKHILVAILLVSIVAMWGGMLSFGVFIFAAFAMLAYMWYANR